MVHLFFMSSHASPYLEPGVWMRLFRQQLLLQRTTNDLRQMKFVAKDVIYASVLTMTELAARRNFTMAARSMFDLGP